MTQSIVVVRLTRNLRYKLTYVQIFESFLKAEPEPVVSDLLEALIQAQQSAIAPLSRYLRHLDLHNTAHIAFVPVSVQCSNHKIVWSGSGWIWRKAVFLRFYFQNVCRIFKIIW